MAIEIAGLADITRRHAAERPDAPAIVHAGRVTTYSALDRAASRVANGLIAHGIRPQARVAHLDKSSDQFFELLFKGYLYIYDRVKDMIVSGGENIYPAEVESALFGHPAVADVAVIGVPDERWGEAVKTIVVRKPEAAVTAGELITWARERIVGYKLPKSVDFIDALPCNQTGKILKRELRKPYWGDKQRQVN